MILIAIMTIGKCFTTKQIYGNMANYLLKHCNNLTMFYEIISEISNFFR